MPNDPMEPDWNAPPHPEPSSTAGLVRKWAEQPISVAAALALLLTSYAIGHAYSARAAADSLATTVEFQRQLLELREQSDARDVTFNAKQAEVRKDILDHQDKMANFLNNNTVLAAQLCNRQ